jgi:ligand-binding sensor domain-containing protein
MIRKYIFLFILFCSSVITAQNKISDTFLEGAIISSFRMENGEIWVSTYGQGIFHYSVKESKWENYSTSRNNIEQDFFYCIAVSKDFVWAGSGEGLFTFDIKRKTWAKRKFSLGGELGNWIRALYYDKAANILWIGRFINLTRFDVSTRKYSDFDLSNNGDPKANNFKVIKPDGDSLIWFGTESGVFKYYKGQRIENPASRHYISNKTNGFKGEGETVSLSDFYFDASNVWFGTDEFITPQKPKFNVGGIYRYNRKSGWDKISSEDGLEGNGIYCLENTGRKMWAGLYSFDVDAKKDDPKGLVLIDRVRNKAVTISLDELGIKSRKISCMEFDGDFLWFGTDNGLCRLRISNPLAKWTLEKKTEKQAPKNNEKTKPKRKK